MTSRVKKFLRRTGVVAVAVALLTAPSTATAVPKERPEVEAAMQAFVDAGFGGIQVRVHDEQGEWAGSAGAQKVGSPAKPPTNGSFWVGSVTKTFTATVVLQLVAEGKLRLDDPVAGYLPRLGLDRRITTRMLLQHTSGLFNYTGEYYDDGTTAPGIPATGHEWVENRFHSYTPEELVRLALSKPPRFAPGTDQNYSNTNYTLALLLIEKLTGHSYADEVRRRILRPLDLRGTVVPGSRTNLPGPHAHGYYLDNGKLIDVTRQNMSLLAGAGDMISTTKDLRTFISALMSGKLLPATLLAQMRDPHGKLGYGFGLFVQDLGPTCGGTVYQHNGSPPAGYGAMMYSSPDGTKTLTASVTMGARDINPVTEFPKALGPLLTAVFCTK
jgi:D-alanyl-D-alanine carboxypeptidase